MARKPRSTIEAAARAADAGLDAAVANVAMALEASPPVAALGQIRSLLDEFGERPIAETFKDESEGALFARIYFERIHVRLILLIDKCLQRVRDRLDTVNDVEQLLDAARQLKELMTQFPTGPARADTHDDKTNEELDAALQEAERRLAAQRGEVADGRASSTDRAPGASPEVAGSTPAPPLPPPSLTKSCRECFEEYEVGDGSDDGFCSDACHRQYDRETGDEAEGED